MSGIFGLLRFEGAPANPEQLNQMAAAMQHRGPDGIHQRSDRNIGVGHLMLHTTQESLTETLPLVSDDGNMVLTADARIDNREDLIKTLALVSGSALTISDSEIILAAYQKWGEDCPAHLMGDFAFAIWSSREQKLFCAVDHLAIRPLFYIHTPKLFAFASEIKALHVLPESSQTINEASIATHLTLVTCHEPGETFYKGIYKLLPGERMTVYEQSLHKKTWWQLDPEKTLRLESDQAYADAFRELFSNAVACRLRSAFPVGVQLSGGLDSCSITATANHLNSDSRKLQVYSAWFDGIHDTDERPYVDDVLSYGNYQAFRFNGNEINPEDNLERFLSANDEPLYNPFTWVDRHLQQQAKSDGTRVMLDGLDGDATVAPIGIRESYFPELIRNGQWKTLLGEVNGHAECFKSSRLRTLIRFGILPLLPLWLSDRLRTGRAYGGLLTDVINPVFARKFQVEHRLQQQGGYYWTPRISSREAHFIQASHRYTGRMEMLHRVAALSGIEYRHPFADRRLMEFCLAIPTSQKLYRGLGRMVMRRAMSDFLPESVLRRPGKGRLDFLYLRPFFHKLAPRIIKNVDSLSTYIEPDVATSALERYVNNKDNGEVVNADRLVTLALWLHPEIFSK